MRAAKAITALNLALESDPAQANIPRDPIIGSLGGTAGDTSATHKETSEGRLSLPIPVSASAC